MTQRREKWLRWRARIIVRTQVMGLRLGLKMRSMASKTRGEVTFILWLVGMGLIVNGVRMMSVPGAWITAGGIVVYATMMAEKSSLAQVEREKLEDLYRKDDGRQGEGSFPRRGNL